MFRGPLLCGGGVMTISGYARLLAGLEDEGQEGDEVADTQHDRRYLIACEVDQADELQHREHALDERNQHRAQSVVQNGSAFPLRRVRRRHTMISP